MWGHFCWWCPGWLGVVLTQRDRKARMHGDSPKMLIKPPWRHAVLRSMQIWEQSWTAQKNTEETETLEDVHLHPLPMQSSTSAVNKCWVPAFKNIGWKKNLKYVQRSPMSSPSCTYYLLALLPHIWDLSHCKGIIWELVWNLSLQFRGHALLCRLNLI